MWCFSDSALELILHWNWWIFASISPRSSKTLVDYSLSCLNLSCNSPIIAPTISLIDSWGNFWRVEIEVEIEASCNLVIWSCNWMLWALNSLIWLRYSSLSSKFYLWSWEFWLWILTNYRVKASIIDVVICLSWSKVICILVWV